MIELRCQSVIVQSGIRMHHSGNNDPMAEHYDFSEEILKEELTLKRQAFTAHEDSIMAQVAIIKRRSLS